MAPAQKKCSKYPLLYSKFQIPYLNQIDFFHSVLLPSARHSIYTMTIATAGQPFFQKPIAVVNGQLQNHTFLRVIISMVQTKAYSVYPVESLYMDLKYFALEHGVFKSKHLVPLYKILYKDSTAWYVLYYSLYIIDRAILKIQSCSPIP